ncbi:MAG: hypothetical protein PHF79_02975 [Candidatus Pacebacteria bacterium]|nr:hypothetical protein [Candidatus Paceibacterota bacterium]
MSKLKPIIIIVIIVVIGFFVYSYFFVNKAPVQSTGGLSQTNVAAGSGSDLTPDQSFVTQLATIDTISLKDDIFNDPVFASLVDFSRELVPQTPGRPNPFAPLGSNDANISASSSANGGVTSASATSTKTATSTKK